MTDTQREHIAVSTGKAELPPILKSRALSYFDSQVLTYLHEKLNTAVSMGNHDLTLLKSEVYGAIINLQPAAQRNNEAALIKRIDTALDRFERIGLLHRTDLNGQPAIKTDLILLVMLPRDELERFNCIVESLLDGTDVDSGPADKDEADATADAQAEPPDDQHGL
jgi:hypothetical protein